MPHLVSLVSGRLEQNFSISSLLFLYWCTHTIGAHVYTHNYAVGD
jgi:hypothetical protein